MSDGIHCSREENTNNKRDWALVVVLDDSEAVDVTVSVDVFRRFGMNVALAGVSKDRPCKLNNTVALAMELSLVEARSVRPWRLIVLAGGAQKLDDEDIAILMKQHIEGNAGIVAAMGAGATRCLYSLGYVDALGGTRYLQAKSKTVIQEYNKQVWVSPGLGTAFELALAVGEHMYGTDRAGNVARSLAGFGETNVLVQVRNERTQSCRTNGLTGESGGCSETTTELPKKRRKNACCEVVRTSTSEMGREGTTADQKVASPGIVRGGKNGVRNEASQSTVGVLGILNATGDPSFADPLQKHQQSFQCIKRKHSISNFDPVFEHIVWTRLEKLGWSYRDDECTSSLSFFPPSCTDVELEGQQEIMDFLLEDQAWRCRDEVLCALDLYYCTRRVQKSSFPSDLSPALLEQETKRRNPSLVTY